MRCVCLCVYLELAAVPRGPLELLLEHRGPLVDLLKHFVKVEVLRVRLAVHRLVLRSLLRRHDRAEVTAKISILIEGMVVLQCMNTS